VIRYFCPQCWTEVGSGDQQCPRCGADLTEDRDYFDKLVLALESPDYTTARRAAYLLGVAGDPRAVPYLVRQLGKEDPYLAAEAVQALGRIGSREALSIVQQARQHRFAVVRRAAAAVLSEPGGREPG